MNFQHLTKFLVAGLTCSSLLVSTSQSVSGNSLSKIKTVPTLRFECKLSKYKDKNGQDKTVYVTKVKGLLTGREFGPLFTWQYAEYDKWPPTEDVIM